MAKSEDIWIHRYKKTIHLIQVYGHFLWAYGTIIIKKVLRKEKSEIVAISLSQHFGDIVAAEPLTQQIRETHPNAYIIWITKPAFNELLIENPYIDEVLTEYCANQRRLLIESGVFDKVYNLQLHRNSFCSICSVFVSNKNTDLTPENYYNYGNLLHIQQILAELPAHDATPKVYITEANKRKVDDLKLPKKYIVIHTQSNEASRNWVNEKWVELLNYIFDKKQYYVVEIGLKSNLNIKNDRFINLCEKLTLLDTAEVIRRATLFIGIDSGPAHFANAVNTMGIILLGRWADFKNHQPFSGNYKHGVKIRIIRSDMPTSSISVETVIGAIENINL